MHQPPEAYHPLSRRQLLRLFGVGGLGLLVGYSRFVKPQPTVWQPDQLTLPLRLTEPLRVTVIGGGLAGLACAYELSQRGFQVTLLERAPQLGGKIAGWPIDVNGVTLQMEHGFHGFFPQYYNLNQLVREVGCEDNFVFLHSYAVVYKNGYAVEVFRPSHSAFPWNIVDLAVASPNRWRWGLNLTSPTHWAVFREITGFDPVHSYQRLDHLSVLEWVGDDFPRGLFDLYFLPFAKSSLNAPDVLSAGELMQFFHFYFFGNPEGLAFRGTRQDMRRSLVEPIADRIRANGGTIKTGVTITALHWQGGKIAGLTVQSDGNGRAAPFWVSKNSVLPAGYYGAGDAVYRVQGQEALCLTCPHQGCTVQAQPNGGYRCPCHGAEFTAQGDVVKGPATRNLSKYTVIAESDQGVQLVAQQISASTPEHLQSDYYVLATDVPGAQQIIRLSQGDPPHPDVVRQIESLAVADPFAVVRFWLDRDFEWPYSYFTSLSGYRLTDSITLYHRIQEDYKAWAQATGGSVVELHAYCYKEKDFPTQEALLTTFEQELYEIVPALRGAKILHRELVNQKNFSGFPPGSYADRPTSATSVPNLFFAGDWVKMPFPCALMERAVSSGFLAANEILHRQGLQRRPLYSVHPRGWLAT
ncbi:MAG: FAD-dependent oxidoreductase [Gloeomargarita sp. SKYB31]|nr:FAD-dependent oxidoreductase [Gloeomargarita sp. SKYB31]